MTFFPYFIKYSKIFNIMNVCETMQVFKHLAGK